MCIYVRYMSMNVSIITFYVSMQYLYAHTCMYVCVCTRVYVNIWRIRASTHYLSLPKNRWALTSENTETHTHAHTHMQTHRQRHRQIQKYQDTYTQTHTLSFSRTLSHAHSFTHTHSLSLSLPLSLTHTHLRSEVSVLPLRLRLAARGKGSKELNRSISLLIRGWCLTIHARHILFGILRVAAATVEILELCATRIIGCHKILCFLLYGIVCIHVYFQTLHRGSTIKHRLCYIYIYIHVHIYIDVYIYIYMYIYHRHRCV